MTTANRQFQTAARRRSGDPISFTIEYVTVNAETNEPTEAEATFRVDPLLDIVRLGAAVSGFGQTLANLGSDTITAEEKLAALDRETPKVRQALRQFFVPPDRAAWDTVAPTIDLQTLGELVRWLTQEVSGMDPTQRTSSSDGSSTAGSTSTAGVPPDA
jgi:hypothetical protein